MKNLIAIIVVVLVALGLSSLYVVKEGERAILIQFGKVDLMISIRLILDMGWMRI